MDCCGAGAMQGNGCGHGITPVFSMRIQTHAARTATFASQEDPASVSKCCSVQLACKKGTGATLLPCQVAQGSVGRELAGFAHSQA